MKAPTINLIVNTETLDNKILRLFPGKTVRKDLTKKLKEGANVPVYVLEFLLGKYCGTKNEVQIEAGVRKIKQILSKNYIRPDESQKALALLRKNGTFTVIDHVTVRLNIRKNEYAADLSSMGLTNLPIEDKYPESYERLLCGGIWCLAELSYAFSAGNKAPIRVKSLAPIQMPHLHYVLSHEFKLYTTKYPGYHSLEPPPLLSNKLCHTIDEKSTSEKKTQRGFFFP